MSLTEGVTEGVSYFVKQTIALMKGDTDEALALKNRKRAIAGIKAELTQLELLKMDAEQEVEDAEALVKAAKFPVELITDTKSYIFNLKEYLGLLETRQDALDDVNHSIEFQTGLLAEISK